MQRSLLPLAAGLAIALPAQAADILHDGIPAWTVPGSNVSVDVRGRLLYDLAWGDEDYALPAPRVGDSEWRAARLGADITAGQVKLTAEFDFAGDDFQPTDFMLAWTVRPGFVLRAGHFKEAVSLEETTSALNTTFMERGSFTDAFSFARRVGVGAVLSGDNWGWTTAIQGGNMDGFDVLSNGWAISTHGGFAPILDRDAQRILHVGAYARYRDHGDGADPLFRYRQRPLAHLSPNTISTSAFAEEDTLIGMEFAGIHGPLHAQGEISRLSAEDPGQDADFDGGFINLGWFVTGESRTYDQALGRLDRLRPARPLGRGGFGAVELAVRYDWIDLNDGAIAGGSQSNITLAANWYPTTRTRVMLNYIDSDVDGGPFGGGDSQIVQTRFQFEW